MLSTPFDDVDPRPGTTRKVRQWPLLYGLMAMLAFGSFSIGAAAQAQAPIIFHGRGTFASARYVRLSSTTNTFMYINVSRDAQEGGGSAPIVTTNVSYGVCVLTISTNIEVCQNGYGTIANSELSGDINYGLGTSPEALTLSFNSAIEPGYLLYASECDENDQTCSNTTPSGGVVAVNWRKNGLSSTTSTGASEERFLNKLTFKSVGQSRYFSADSWGTITGTPFFGTLYPTELGSVRNFTFTVVLPR